MGVYEHMLDALGLPGGDGLRDRLYVAFTDLDHYALFDDVAPVLAALTASDLTLGVVSNYEPWLEELLEHLGVRDLFSVRVISGREGVEKPDPAIYQLALQRANVLPSEAVFVGDNPEFDTDPPSALGMATVLIDRRRRHPAHVGSRIEHLAHLPSMLEAM